MTMDRHLQTLLDERDLHRLVVRAWGGIDRHDWTTYADAFTDDGAFEIMGQRRHGRADIAAGPARDLAHYEALQHIVTNFAADVDGDDAHGGWYALAIHVPDAADAATHADVGLRYAFRARRTDAGWRLADVTVEVVWSAGSKFAIAEHPHDA